MGKEHALHPLNVSALQPGAAVTVDTLLTCLPDPAAVLDTRGFILQSNAGFDETCFSQQAVPGERPSIYAILDEAAALQLHRFANVTRAATVTKLCTPVRRVGAAISFCARRIDIGMGEDAILIQQERALPADDHPAVSNFADAKAKQHAAEVLQMSNKLQLAIDASGMGVWEFDFAKGTVHWDDRMLEIYGVPDADNTRTGNFWHNHLHPEDRDEILSYSERCVAENRDFNRDFRILRPDGDVRHIRSLSRFIRALGEKGKLVGVNIDITEDRRRADQLEAAKKQLEYDSRHDALTGLANRRLLDEVVDKHYEQIAPDALYGAMHLDLDFFKQINDQHGHAVGDQVLRHVSKHLLEVAQDRAVVSRVGGDEFVLFFSRIKDVTCMTSVAGALIDRIKAPSEHDGILCSVGASIGIAVGRGKPARRAEVFIQADVALYQAKDAGRSCFCVYAP